MVSVLNRKLRRDLLRTRGLLIAIIAIIAVGTGSFVGMLATYNNLEISKKPYYSQCRMADFWIDLKKAPVSEVQRLCNIDGVSEIRDRIVFQVVVDLEGVAKPVSGQVVSMPPEPAPVLNNLVMRRGSYFTRDRRNEVIVSEKFAKARHVEPGSFIHLILNGQRKKLFVVGTAISSEYIYMAPPGGFMDDPKQYGLFFLKRDYAEDMFGFHGVCNNVIGMLTPKGREWAGPILHQLGQKLNDYGVFTTTPRKQQFSNLTLTSEMNGLKTLATMLPILFLGTAALVLNVLMTRMAKQQRVTVGTLKALGYSNREVFFHFLQYGILVGLIGGLAGCLLGYWISGAMTHMYVGIFEFPRLVNYAYPSLMAIAVCISLFFSVLGTFRGVKNITKLNPAEAMRQAMPAQGGKIILERIRGFWNRMDFRWQIVWRNIFRNKTRTVVAVAAAAMGAALVVLAFGFMNSMSYWLEFQFDMVMLSDYNMVFKDEVDGGALYEAKRLPGVAHAEPIFTVPCTFQKDNHHKKGAIKGLVHDALLTVPHNKKGESIPIPPVGLLMNKRLAEYHLHIKEGDTITITPIKGLRMPHEVKVVKLVDSMIGMPVYADYRYLNRLLGEESDITEIQFKARQSDDERSQFFKQAKRYPTLQSLSAVKDQKIQIKKQMVGAMNAMAVVMIIFAGVIFFGSILNGSLIAIEERQREMATFRVLGYRSTEIGVIFLRENMVTNLFGAFIGFAIGKWMLIAMMQQYINDSYSMPSVVYPMTWVYTLLLTVFFVLASHVIVQRSITRQNWPEALSMKE